jgi:hypothetical protein
VQDRAVQRFRLAPTEQLRPDRQASGSPVDSTLSDHGSQGERAHCRPMVGNLVVKVLPDAVLNWVICMRLLSWPEAWICC